MSLKINSFGGPAIWFLRKYYSSFTSKVMLRFVECRYKKNTKKYVEWFLAQKKPPIFCNVMIETINRCNGKCAFCSANVNAEKRPFKKMSEETFHEIIRQLKDIGWNGKLFMCVNNEPFIDKRIIEFSRYAKRELTGIKIAVITNGTLLTKEKMDEMVGVVDQLTINDYSERYSLSDTHKKIYSYVKRNSIKFSSMNILINRRFSGEILATRAGNAPNKPKKNVDIQCSCLYPFMDLIVYPDGKVGMCCNDCFEITDFGNVWEQPLKAIWEGIKYQKLRESMQEGRMYFFCKDCDVLDAGEREDEIQSWMI